MIVLAAIAIVARPGAHLRGVIESGDDGSHTSLRRRGLRGVLRLWQAEGWTAVGPDGLTLDRALELLRAEGAVAVVAETEREISGAGLAALVGQGLGARRRVLVTGAEGTIGQMREQLGDRYELVSLTLTPQEFPEPRRRHLRARRDPTGLRGCRLGRPPRCLDGDRDAVG